MEKFLDDRLCKDFRDAINSSPVFVVHDERRHYNLICAVMDRMDSCVEFLNANADHPKNEEDFIIFVMFSCIVYDAVKKLLKEISVKYIFDDKDNPESYKYFKEACRTWPDENDEEFYEYLVKGDALSLSEEDCPTDDKFFEYFRSLAFAHPFGTNRAKFLKPDETQYSPWVIVNSPIAKEGSVGLRIYTSALPDETLRLVFQFSALKEYIKSRYDLIKNATDWAKNVVLEKENEWKKRKVNRELSSVDILKDIRDILTDRHVDYYICDIDEVIAYIECESTVSDNNLKIQEFRDMIFSFIPTLSDSVDNLDYSALSEIRRSIISPRPKEVYAEYDYQIEKTFDYLSRDKHNCDTNLYLKVRAQFTEFFKGLKNQDDHDFCKETWGLVQAYQFSKEFAKKHVIIKPLEMFFDEIKMLVSMACYFEKMEQEAEALSEDKL